MQLILIAAGAIGLVVGSLAAAALLCSFLWYAFRLVLYPEWAVSAVLILLVLALAGDLPKSLFLDMTLTFAVVAAVPLWLAGHAWRKERGQTCDGPNKLSVQPRTSKPFIPKETALSPRLYPAITACICEERPPTREDVHMVATRIWREGFAQRFGAQTVPASFAIRRLLIRAATAALSGKAAVPFRSTHDVVS